MATREEVVSALAHILESGNDLEKCLAAQGLGRLGDSSVGDALIAALRDPDEDVRIDAATAITALSIEAAIPTLIENIVEDPVSDAKLACIRAIAQFRAPEAVPVLCQLVEGMSEEDIAWDFQELAETETDEWLEIQLAAVEALGAIGAEDAVDNIQAAMRDEFGQDLLRSGLSALALMGSRGRDIVLDHLKSGITKKRKTAISVLSKVDPEAVLKLVDQLLADPEPQVRLLALHVLPEVDPRLVDLLRDEDDEVRAAAAARLVLLQPARLETFLDDPSDLVRAAVLRATSELDSPPEASQLADTLLEWLNGKSPALAIAVAEALPALAPEQCREPLRKKALQRGAAGELRRAAIKAIARLDIDNAVDTLVTIASDPLQPVRLEAVGGLASIAAGSGENAGRARQALLAALSGSLISPPEETGDDETEEADKQPEQPSGHGRHAAMEDNTGRVGRVRIDREGNIVPDEPKEKAEASDEKPDEADEETVETGEEDDTFPESTLSAIQDDLSGKLEDVSEDGIELNADDLSFLELAQGRKGKRILSPEKSLPAHQDVRILAARTLTDVPDPDVASALIEVLDENQDDLRTAAALSLAGLLKTPGLLQAEAAEALMRHLQDKNPVLRVWLVRAAAGTDNAEILDVLRDRLEDEEPSVRAEAVLAVSRLDPDFDPALLLKDSDMMVRRLAGEAVVERHGPEACPMLIELAFGLDGTDRLEAARLLRRADPDAANSELVARVTQSEDALTKRIAIEVLTEINAVDRAEATALA